MAPIWKPQSKETLLYYIETLLDEASDELTDWENNFIESVQAQLVYKDGLSQAQEETLEKIYVRRTK